jgi:hypothetical protein
MCMPQGVALACDTPRQHTARLIARPRACHANTCRGVPPGGAAWGAGHWSGAGLGRGGDGGVGWRRNSYPMVAVLAPGTTPSLRHGGGGSPTLPLLNHVVDVLCVQPWTLGPVSLTCPAWRSGSRRHWARCRLPATVARPHWTPAPQLHRVPGPAASPLHLHPLRCKRPMLPRLQTAWCVLTCGVMGCFVSRAVVLCVGWACLMPPPPSLTIRFPSHRPAPSRACFVDATLRRGVGSGAVWGGGVARCCWPWSVRRGR